MHNKENGNGFHRACLHGKEVGGTPAITFFQEEKNNSNLPLRNIFHYIECNEIKSERVYIVFSSINNNL